MVFSGTQGYYNGSSLELETVYSECENWEWKVRMLPGFPFHVDEEEYRQTVLHSRDTSVAKHNERGDGLLVSAWILLFLLFCYYLTLEKGGALHLNNLESPSDVS